MLTDASYTITRTLVAFLQTKPMRAARPAVELLSACWPASSDWNRCKAASSQEVWEQHTAICGGGLFHHGSVEDCLAVV